MNLAQLQRRCAFLLALIMPFSLVGCKGQDNSSNEENVSIEENFNEFTKEDLTKFLSQMSEIIPLYNLEEIYLSEEEISAIIQASENMQKCDNTSVDITELSETIINNSIDNKGRVTINYDLSSAEKEEISNTIKEALRNALLRMDNYRGISPEDACVLKDIKIIIGKTSKDSYMHYDSKEKTLIVDYQEFIKMYNNIENEILQKNNILEGISRYLEYGLNYGCLQACDCRQEKGQENEVISYGKVLEVLQESAAISGNNHDLGAINKAIFDNLTLRSGRGTSLMLLLSVFKENRNIEDLNKAIFDCNLKGVYDFFALKTEEEIAEFYKIAKSIDILTVDDEYENNFYAETRATDILDFRNHIGYAYKVSIFKTSIKDLIKYLGTNKDLTKEEAMFLYKFVKSIAVNETYTKTQYNNYYYEPNYVQNIISIENIFFEFLSKFYSLTPEEVDELYEEYYYFDDLEYNIDSLNIDITKLNNKFPLLQFIITNYPTHNSCVDNFDNSLSR